MRAKGHALCRFLMHVSLWLAASTVVAQEKPLTIESSVMQPSVVVGRPIQTWWDVKISGAGLMVGRFQFFIKSENQLLVTVETEELTLNGPEQRIRVMLPPIDPPYPLDRLNVDITFHGKKFSGKVSEQILRIPFSSKHVFVGLVGETRGVRKRTSQRDKMLERLKFETLLHSSTSKHVEDEDLELVKTFFASIDPADFPSDPLMYCGYDIVVLMGDEFRNLRKPQLEALLAWVKAGGGLYVEPHGVLETFHVDFLRNLIADDPQGLVIEVDRAGKLPPDTVPQYGGAVVVACGLGHAVIRTEDPSQELNVAPQIWRLIIGPLWKLRVKPVSANGRRIGANFTNIDPWGFMNAQPRRFHLPQSDLLDRLMPDGVRMVPLSLLAFMLFAFVLLIGPGDYFLLGWLRVRKLTWLTFPIATLTVTALTVWLSNSYMSAAETRRAAIIRDLGPSGEIVRTNRFELLFVASSRRVTTEVEKGLMTSPRIGESVAVYSPGVRPMQRFDVNEFGERVRLPTNANGLDFDSDVQVKIPVMQIQGRIPTHFTMTQDLAKWTPQLNRCLTIPGNGTKPAIDWKEFNLRQSESDTIHRHQLPPALIARVRERFGPSAMLACFTGTDGWAYDQTQGWRSTRSIEEQPPKVGFYSGSPRMRRVDPYVNSQAEFFRWLYEASVVKPNPGIFQLTKQTSPKGNAACDDLPLLDANDPQSWLLVVVIPQNDDYIVYRKLMRFED